MNNPIKYPVDTASFQRLREDGYLYVDKTEYIHKLISSGRYYFLARPRRFGKSMLLNTLEAFFLNRRELFKGLALDTLQPDPWEESPILRLDLTGTVYNSKDRLENMLHATINRWEDEYCLERSEGEVSMRFYDLILRLAENTGKKVVVLVDEYDAPLTENIDRKELQEQFREQLRGFYSVLKKADDYLRFCMLTGVTRYGKVSVFSGLNNLNDITFKDAYAGVCGITEEELHRYYEVGVGEFAKKEGITVPEAFERLKFHYDGYHFSECLLDVYNPFSINHALADLAIKDYWCASGAPTVFIKQLKEMDFELDKLTRSEVSEERLSNLSMFSYDPVPLFFQTGYLTLKTYEKDDDLYTIGYPNREVERGLLRNLLQVYKPHDDMSTDITIKRLRNCLRQGEPEKFVELLRTFFAGIPSDLHRYVGKYENYYHSLIYALLTLVGLDTRAEYGTSHGFIDLLIKMDEYIYIIELKINGTAQDAMQQIERKEYTLPFAKDSRRLYRIGIGFSKSTHNIDSYIIE